MVDFRQVKKELRNKLRNQDFIDVSTRGVTTVQDDFNGTGVQVDFSLTNLKVKNVRTVVVDSVTLDYGFDWDFTFDNVTQITTINFVVAPPSGTNNVEITYDYGDSDRIFSDFTQVFVTNSKFPRIGFDIIGSSTENRSISESALLKTILDFEFRAYGVGRDQTEDLATEIRTWLDANKKTFYCLNWIRKNGTTQLIPVDGTNNKIFVRGNSYVAPFEFER